MTTRLYSALLLTASISLAGCQTTEIMAPKTIPYSENIIALTSDILDSDGDGITDDLDDCPETPSHKVVDIKGCLVELDVGGLEMEFVGFFPAMSSQLPTIYDAEFAKVAEKLNEYPEASVFIFGHIATNEIDESSLATFGLDSLSHNRALFIKNNLVLQHNIDAERIRTYNCSNKLLVNDTAYIDPSFKPLNLKNLESKQRRATLMASSSVHDLTNLKYDYYIKIYGEYAKHCKLFG